MYFLQRSRIDELYILATRKPSHYPYPSCLLRSTFVEIRASSQMT
jgi:hypothetical protein